MSLISPPDPSLALSQIQGFSTGGKRLTPAFRRFFALAGDSVLLLSLAMLSTLPVLHFSLEFQIGRYQASMWQARIIWSSVAFVGWYIGAKIAQAQEPGNLVGRLKSPLCALIALILTAVFWVLIMYSFVNDEIAAVQRILVFLALAIPVFGIWRVFLACIINLPHFQPRAVIVGVNRAAESVARELLQAKCYTARVLGYISADVEEETSQSILPILGDRIVLHELIHKGQIDMIIMAIDYKANPELFREALEAVQFEITVLPMATAYERTSGKIPVQYAGDQWYISLPSEMNLSPLYLCWRKLMDLSFGLLGIFLILIILPVLAPLIYLDSPGPLFYKQERLGRNGRPFNIYKFRSMRLHAEQKGQAVWATIDDARITRIGRFLRATHLDELPQALNVMRGEMSLIGPRPERQEFVSKLEKQIPFYRCRMSIKPGLTGWAQVKYSYARSGQEALEKLQYDLYYIKHQAFLLDILIILKTIGEVLLHRGT